MKISKLKEKKIKLEDELYELHFVEKNPNFYKIRRQELELLIAHTEAEIDFEKSIKPFKILFIGFVIAIIGILANFYL